MEERRYARREQEARRTYNSPLLRAFGLHSDCSFDASFGPQAAGLAISASHDHTLRVWRLSDRACLRTIKGHTDWVQVVVDVGGGRVVSGGGDRVLRVWDVLSGRQLQQIPTIKGGVYFAVVLADGRVVTAHGGCVKLRLWRLGEGGGASGVLAGHTGDVCALALVGGGAGAQQLLASGGFDGSIHLWDVGAGTCVAVLHGYGWGVCCLADLGGGRLLSRSVDRLLRVWDVWCRLPGHG